MVCGKGAAASKKRIAPFKFPSIVVRTFLNVYIVARNV